MADIFNPEPIIDGDRNVWGQKNTNQLRRSEGVLTASLFRVGGTVLKITDGLIGFYDGVSRGTAQIEEQTIDFSACSNSNWFAVEISVSVYTINFAATSISGATDPKLLPDDFKNAWRGDRGGFYIDPSKRCIGLGWKNSSGTVQGIVNCLPFIDGWSGFGRSDDGLGNKYVFEKNIETDTIQQGDRTFDGALIVTKKIDCSYATGISGNTFINHTDFLIGNGTKTLQTSFNLKKPIMAMIECAITSVAPSSSNSFDCNLELNQAGVYVPLQWYNGSSFDKSFGHIGLGGSSPVSLKLYSLVLNPGEYRFTTTITIATGTTITIEAAIQYTGIYGLASDYDGANDIIEIL